ncbi:LysE family translocator [Paucibacter sp. DJ1R-11]|uniref:LysE family translocator n=1 Tax=Paucibacter sp. DJ1R-11 TaxID=2893556 RepID=UPI0021E4E793|nr:LysE family translocator [Paucibacter sp. DJ1R-11]MCV2362466.1 LysE family translocator [Paucibacter sp. DJ1R-11]
MLLSPTELLPLASYCFLMSSTPGPNNLMLATAAANAGYRRTLPQMLGSNTGVGVQTWLTCLGLGSLFLAYPVLHQVLRVLGTLYLVYLAWQLSGLRIGAAQQDARPLSFAQAALFQAINPKSWVKAITLATVFMPSGVETWVGASLVAVVGVLVGLPSSTMWALFGLAIRQLLQDPVKRRVFNLFMAGSLVVLALSLLR